MQKLFDDIISGREAFSLSTEEYDKLKNFLAPVLESLSEFEKGLAKTKAQYSIGEQFEYGGQGYVVAKHGSTTAWKKAYDIAFSSIDSAEIREAVQKTVDELKKPTTKLLRI